MRNILIVDDEELNRLILSDKLKSNIQNVNIIEATNGKEAISRVEENLISLIILDMHMPVQNGIETLKQLKQSKMFNSIPVYMYSGEENTQIIKEALQLGAENYFIKPLNEEDIRLKLPKLIKSSFTGLPVINLSEYSADSELIDFIPEDLARGNILVPVKKQGGKIVVAFDSPENIVLVEDIEKITGKPIQVAISTKDEILKFQNKLYGLNKIVSLNKQKEGIVKNKDILEDEKKASNSPNEIVKIILEQAIISRASDIHIEPSESYTKIRYRIDGSLQEVLTLKDNISHIISKLKVMSSLDITVKRKPQDGRINFKHNDKFYEIRISTFPLVYGEKIVMRIIDKQSIILDLGDLGITEEDFDKIGRLLKMPHGILLVCGPTGSGKTTTLYSLTDKLKNKDINMVTVEDPVESVIEGVNQSQVSNKSGLGFAESLKYILRQDPDIIMVGEVRDSETAKLAIQAGITGHYVLSTLHVNDSIGAVSRLLDLGVEQFMITNSLIGSVSQRLIKKICPHCKESYIPTLAERKALPLELEDNFRLHKGKGCFFCNNTGYLGRVAVFEILEINDSIKNIIATTNDTDEIKKKARENGFKTIKEGALNHLIKGNTTLNEFLRVGFSL